MANLDMFYGGGGEGDNADFGGAGGQMSFTDFLNQRNNLMQGGYGDVNGDNFDFGGAKLAKKGKPANASNSKEVEVREGYDSFTIFESSVGETGHRFISKSPYGAASKAATTLFNLKGGSAKKSLNFILKKTTRGSNGKLYAYDATMEKLADPVIVFKKDEAGNRIIMTHYNQVLRVDKNKNILNAVQSGKGKKDKLVYDSKTTLNTKFSASELTEFDYKPYVLFETYSKVTVKSAVVPDDLKGKQKNVVKKEKDALKKAEQKEKKAEKKEKDALKKAEKKEKDALKKAAKKEKEAAKKAAKKEKEAAKPKTKKAKKAKKPKADGEEVKVKKPRAKKPKASPKTKKPKAPKVKKPKASPKAKKPRAKKAKATGGYCGMASQSCGGYDY